MERRMFVVGGRVWPTDEALERMPGLKPGTVTKVIDSNRIAVHVEGRSEPEQFGGHVWRNTKAPL